MPKIRHIALTTTDPSRVAAFYKEAFGMQEVRRNPRGAVFLTDGYINLAILNTKMAADPDVGAQGEGFCGLHHIGFEVDSLDRAAADIERANGRQLTRKDEPDLEMAAPSGHGDTRNFEMKWAGPDEVVIDISHTGWEIGVPGRREG